MVEEARRAGLACSLAKSELLVIPRNKKKQLPSNIKLYIEGREIPEVMALKVLGLQIQSTRLNHNFLQTVERHVNQTISLLKRVTSKHSGLTEQDRVRLLQAFVVSRIVYSIPYQRQKPTKSMFSLDAPTRWRYVFPPQLPLPD